MALAAALGQPLLVEAAAVVGHQQRDRPVGLADADADVLGTGVGGGVSQRLLCGAEHQLFGLGGQAQTRLHVHVHVHAARRERSRQIGQRRRQAVVAQRSRIDLDQQRAELPDRVSGAGRTLGQHPAQHRLGLLLLDGRGHLKGVAGQLLDDAVVEACRDRPPLLVGGVQRPLQQLLAVALGVSDPARHPPRQRDLQRCQQQQRGDSDRGEPAHQAAAVAGDRARAQVLLEQHRRAVLRAQAQVDRGEIALAALVGVLGLRQVGHLGGGRAATQRGQLVSAEREAAADQQRLVGVEDLALGVPHLDAGDVGRQHPPAHDPVEPRDRRRPAPHDVGGERRLDDAVAGDVGQPAGVLQRLVGAEAAKRVGAGHRHQRSRHQRRQREHQHRASDRGRFLDHAAG